MIISKNKDKFITYVGYTNNILDRLKKHNKGKGAKSTRGKKWKLIYKKNFNNKSAAMKYEYFLKKNYKMRKKIKSKYIYSL